MIAYLAYFTGNLRSLLSYRVAALAGFVTQAFWGLLRIAIFSAFYRSLPRHGPDRYIVSDRGAIVDENLDGVAVCGGLKERKIFANYASDGRLGDSIDPGDRAADQLKSGPA